MGAGCLCFPEGLHERDGEYGVFSVITVGLAFLVFGVEFIYQRGGNSMARAKTILFC